MNKLCSLLRAMMSGGIQIFNYRARSELSRRLVPFLLAAVVGTGMLLSSSALVIELGADGGETTVLSIFTFLTAIIILTEGVYKSGDLLFKPRDNDMLLAMPIEKRTIVAARVIKLYVFELLYCMIFLLPAAIAYAMNCAVSPSYFLVTVTMLILAPIIPLVVACLVGLVSSAISAKFKHRTLLQVVISFIALTIFAVMILAINMAPDLDGQTMIALGDRINMVYYPAAVFAKLTTSFDIWQYLLFVGVNLAVAVVAILLISKFYFRIVSRLSAAVHSENVVAKYNFTRHSQTSAVVRKELTKYFSTPVLLMNTAIGLVLFLVAVGAVYVQYDNMLQSLPEDFPLTPEEIHAYMPGVTFAMVAFASLMTFITATTFSLEGRAFNLLKSMPISGRRVIMAKVLAAMILIMPVTALGSLVMWARFQFGFVDGMLVFVAVVFVPLVTELIGVLIDLKYARFDAESDAVVVKQSAGVLVATFLGLGMVLTTISLTFAVVFIAGQTAGLAIIDAVFVIVALYLCLAVATRGEEKYMRLVA